MSRRQVSAIETMAATRGPASSLPIWIQKLDEAYNKNDAAAVAALFHGRRGFGGTGLDVQRSEGRRARYKETFQRSPITDFNSRRERRHLNAIDNAVWSAGQWASTFQSQTVPVFAWATGQRFMFGRVMLGRSPC
jgi:hypothetical protein